MCRESAFNCCRNLPIISGCGTKAGAGLDGAFHPNNVVVVDYTINGIDDKNLDGLQSQHTLALSSRLDSVCLCQPDNR